MKVLKNNKFIVNTPNSPKQKITTNSLTLIINN